MGVLGMELRLSGLVSTFACWVFLKILCLYFLWFSLLSFWDRIPICSPCGSEMCMQTSSVILLYVPLKCWDYRHVSPYFIFVVYKLTLSGPQLQQLPVLEHYSAQRRHSVITQRKHIIKVYLNLHLLDSIITSLKYKGFSFTTILLINL